MRAIVLAQGGVDPRWANPDGSPFLGVPKHLIPVDGEPLLGRTVRLLRERGVTDIIVTGPQEDRYRFTGARTVTLDQTSWTWPGLNVFHGTRELWDTDGRTTILFGDVFYTDTAMDLIVACDEREVWFHRRPTASTLTGHPWDEPFAFSFLPHDHQRMQDVAQRLVDAWVGPKRLHLWKFFAALQGVDAHDAKACRNLPRQTPIDDWTDDIDRPDQAVAWLGRYYARKIDLSVIIPWRDMAGDRKPLLDFCVEWWERLGAQVVVSSDDPGPHFNVSQARNRGAAACDSDVLVFADADTILPPDQLWAGAYLAQTANQMVLPYTTHVRQKRTTTTQLLRTGKLKALKVGEGRPVHNHVSGVVVVPRSAWGTVRFDERFVGWGAEDRAFYAACLTLLGEHDRLPGESYHLWHKPSPDRRDPDDDPRRAANLALGARYKKAAGICAKTGWLPALADYEWGDADPDAMRAILAEPGGPLEGTWP